MQPINPKDAHALYLQIRRVEEELQTLRRLADRMITPEVRDQITFERQFPTEVIYHIVPKSYYDEYPANKAYLPAQYEKDGFIHCTRGADLMVMVANKHYRTAPGDFLMLALDVRALTSPLKYESFDPVLPFPFPHIYGPINRDAIIELIPMKRANDGTFLIPPFADQK